MIYIYLIIFFFFNFVNASEVNLFTTRHYESDFELYKKFTAETGIKVNVVSGKSRPLEKRIIDEGKDCKADILFLADAGRLVSAENKKIFQKISSQILEKKIPSSMRSDLWVGITKRARILYYSPSKISNDEIENINYEDLANKKWKNKISIRQSNNVYNQSLVASLIENNGMDKTKKWIRGLVSNFSRSPQGNDRAQILSVASGESELAVANTYYYALMLSGKKGKEQKLAAEKVKPVFPNQSNRGVHMNISGAGILKYSPNKKNAIKFLEFLVTPDAQSHIVNNTFEYPIIQNVAPHPLVSRMGEFKQDLITPVSSYGEWQKEAFKIMRESGWD